jgi:hypothetical protein
MKLHVVFAQRKEHYEGEFAPEVVAAVTEYEYDDNPDYLEDQLEKAKHDPDFAAVRLIDVEIEADIRKLLLEVPSVVGKVNI